MCAKEEIEQINIEMQRLQTSIHDKWKHVQQTIIEISATDPPLAQEIHRQCVLCRAVQNVHLKQLSKIENSPRFSGKKGIGELDRTNRPDVCSRSSEQAMPSAHEGIITDKDNSAEEEIDATVDNEVVEQDLDGMETFMEQIV